MSLSGNGQRRWDGDSDTHREGEGGREEDRRQGEGEREGSVERMTILIKHNP